MKKLYTLTFLFAAGLSFGQSVVITKIIDGTFGATCATTGSAPKVVELYVSGTADLAYYRVQTESNGAADEASISWNSGTYLTALGTVTNSFVYLVNGTDPNVFSEIFPNVTEHVLLSSATPNMNGNDALRVALFDTPAPLTGAATGNLVSVIDQFGNPLDVSSETGQEYAAPWAYQDSYVSRNSGVLANAGSFVTSSFTYGGNAAFVGVECAELASTVNLGSYETIAGVAQNDINGLTIYPNPVSGNILNITSNSNGVKAVAIFDVLGKQVINTTTVNNTVDVANLNTGIYMVKITEEGKTATRKLVKQ